MTKEKYSEQASLAIAFLDQAAEQLDGLPMEYTLLQSIHLSFARLKLKIKDAIEQYEPEEDVK